MANLLVHRHLSREKQAWPPIVVEDPMGDKLRRPVAPNPADQKPHGLL